MRKPPKRLAQVRANIPVDLRERIDDVKGNVISMSDWLFELIEERVVEEEAMRIAKQKIGSRMGKN